MSAKAKKTLVTVLKYIALTAMALVVFVPIIGVVFSAFKSKKEMLSTGYMTPPKSFLNFENFGLVAEYGNLATGLANTLIIIAASLVISILLSTMTAYVLRRFTFKGGKIIESLYLVASFIPGVIVHLIIFNNFAQAGLVNKLAAPVILYSGADIMGLYIFMQFISKIPYELDEAAILEGCSYFGVFGRVILPMLKPAAVTFAILKFTAIYNDFYVAFLYLPSESKAVMSTMLYRFMGPYNSLWNVISAGIIVVIIPVLIVFIVAQKYIYKGFVDGAVKA